MKLNLLSDLYERNKLPKHEYEEAAGFLVAFSSFLKERYQVEDIDEASHQDLAFFIDHLVETNQNTISNFVILLRYYRIIGNNELLVHLYRYLGGLDVLENIIDRLTRLHGKATADKLLSGWSYPPLGTRPEAMPAYTDELMNRLNAAFNEGEVKAILAGNNHGVSEKAILPDKINYEAVDSLEVFLKEDNERKIKVLEEHWRENKLWFEQVITEEVIDFVKSDQEIMSGVLRGEYLYLTKIPYDPDGYLQETDPLEKRYLACHCPFAREAVKNKQPISPLWCYCSAGFTKYPYEVILGQKLDIEILESVLNGEDRCRFRIPLAGIDYKK